METLLILAPLLTPLAGIPLTLLLRKRSELQALSAIVLIFAALGFSLGLLQSVIAHGPFTLQLGAWPAPFGITLAADLPGVLMLEMAAQRAGAKKILFGSDGPWLHPGVEMEKVFALHLSPADEALVLGGNFIRAVAASWVPKPA